MLLSVVLFLDFVIATQVNVRDIFIVFSGREKQFLCIFSQKFTFPIGYKHLENRYIQFWFKKSQKSKYICTTQKWLCQYICLKCCKKKKNDWTKWNNAIDSLKWYHLHNVVACPFTTWDMANESFYLWSMIKFKFSSCVHEVEHWTF